MKEILSAIAVLGVMGAAFGGILAVASRVFAVKTDERLPKLVDALPGANCGGCGFAGCQAYAQAVLDGRASVGQCAAGGAASAEKMSQILGVAAVEVERKVAMVKCRGENHLQKGDYEGLSDCRSAMFVAGDGPSACPNGCLGFGTCTTVCKFDAIHVVNGVARVDADKCTGCMQCVEVCPRGVIVPVSKNDDIVVACSNRERGAYTRRVCRIGCGRAESAARIASVTVCQPQPACEFALPPSTVKTGLSRSTPRSAHGVRSPERGIGAPVSLVSSRKIFRKDGGRGTPAGTEKARPMACPGP